MECAIVGAAIEQAGKLCILHVDSMWLLSEAAHLWILRDRVVAGVAGMFLHHTLQHLLKGYQSLASSFVGSMLRFWQIFMRHDGPL